MGQQRSLEWDEMIDKLSPLASNKEGLYLAAETATDTYKDIRYTSDHMAVLGAVGILPMNKLIREDYMKIHCTGSGITGIGVKPGDGIIR